MVKIKRRWEIICFPAELFKYMRTEYVRYDSYDLCICLSTGETFTFRDEPEKIEKIMDDIINQIEEEKREKKQPMCEDCKERKIMAQLDVHWLDKEDCPMEKCPTEVEE